MNRTKIEWTDYTWNPVTGCLNNCPYCYARKIATRFKGTKAWPKGFEPTFHEDRLIEPLFLKKPSKIFVCSMGELFGRWLEDRWIISILWIPRQCPQHIFQFLTKQPEELPRWNELWGSNTWVGVTATNGTEAQRAVIKLKQVAAPIRFISFEPLLGSPNLPDNFNKAVDWVIIGAQTNPYHPPKREWVEEIIEAAGHAEIPVFLKDNLRGPKKRQEFPKRGGGRPMAKPTP